MPNIRLQDEPQFNAATHLALSAPANTISLSELGYDEQVIKRSPSPLAMTSSFQVFSAEGLAVMQHLVAVMKANRNEAGGTGNNRLGSYIRGAGYRSQFVRDFCQCAELLAFLSDLAGTPLAQHSVPAARRFFSGVRSSVMALRCPM